ncbi:hypothetical protein [Aurantiacibacter hainanensis]|uniref:hypothetical protein n=1 Tax=Aurantiacibacter hainanensis TaxID=3076114 RepID=UPI0030C6FDEE
MASNPVNATPAPRNYRERDAEFWQLHAVWKLVELDGDQAQRELAFRDLMLSSASSASAAMLKLAALRTFPATKAGEELRPGMTPLDLIDWDLQRASKIESGLA